MWFAGVVRWIRCESVSLDPFRSMFPSPLSPSLDHASVHTRGHSSCPLKPPSPLAGTAGERSSSSSSSSSSLDFFCIFLFLFFIFYFFLPPPPYHAPPLQSSQKRVVVDEPLLFTRCIRRSHSVFGRVFPTARRAHILPSYPVLFLASLRSLSLSLSLRFSSPVPPPPSTRPPTPSPPILYPVPLSPISDMPPTTRQKKKKKKKLKSKNTNRSLPRWRA